MAISVKNNVNEFKQFCSYLKPNIKQQDDLLWLLIDFDNSIKNNTRLGIIYGLCGGKYKDGIIKDIVIDFNSKDVSFDIVFADDSNLEILVSKDKSVVLQKTNPYKYYITVNDTVYYSIIFYND